MTLLASHLEQISLSATAIAELPFPPPKIFANAMLQPHDITALIRDTEAHERALFTLDPARSSSSSSRRRTTARRGTMFPGDGEKEGMSMASRIYAAKDNKSHQSAVARVLGGDMMNEIKRSTTGATGRTSKGEINVEVLLKGAEMLCNVYPIAGAPEKISSLRDRHQKVSKSITRLEERVTRQSAQLESMSRSSSYSNDYDTPVKDTYEQQQPVNVTDEDLEREMEEIRELELRKKTLEDRVSGMERDLGGLMR